MITGSGNNRKKILVVISALGLMAVYFGFVSAFFPQFYLSLVPQYPKPEIASVKISRSSVPLGQPLEIIVVGTNKGVTSDMQTLSVSFPNMTDTSGISVRSDNFTQQPLVIGKDQEVGSHYAGTQYPVYSQYPIVEAFNRPWDGGASHEITLDVTPESQGKFLILVKSVVLPHADIIHYPTKGVQDQQSEFATPYAISVTKP